MTDPELDLEARAREAEERKLATLKEHGREAALALGRAYGEDEAKRRGESGETRENRIKRAMAYAAWEFDGKPLGYGDRYEQEFGLPARKSHEEGAPRGGADPKNGKRRA